MAMQLLVVVLRAIQFPVLAMLWALVLTIQRMVLLVGMQLPFPFPLYRKQILPSRQEWFAFFGIHVNAPMISLNSRLYSFLEYEAGWSLKSHTVAACSKESAIACFWCMTDLSTFTVGGNVPSSCNTSVFNRKRFLQHPVLSQPRFPDLLSIALAFNSQSTKFVSWRA